MFKRLITLVFLLIMMQANGQPMYLTFSFMKVEDQHLSDYLALEDFWAGIHRQAISEGAYTGWDLWSLMPAGQDQGFQYLTVSIHNDMNSMLKGSSMDQILAWAKKAYPDMSEEKIMEKAMGGAATRTRSVILFIEVLDGTEQEFDMPFGTFATMQFMKAVNAGEYVTSESEVFKPLHQQVVDDGKQGSWSLARIVAPGGSDTYASHITFNMYKDVDQYVESTTIDLNDYVTDWEPVNKGLETRDLKKSIMATLIRKER